MSASTLPTNVTPDGGVIVWILASMSSLVGTAAVSLEVGLSLVAGMTATDLLLLLLLLLLPPRVSTSSATAAATDAASASNATVVVFIIVLGGGTYWCVDDWRVCLYWFACCGQGESVSESTPCVAEALGPCRVCVCAGFREKSTEKAEQSGAIQSTRDGQMDTIYRQMDGGQSDDRL